MSLTDYLPIYEKYLPRSFEECTHSKKTSPTLKKLVNSCSLNEGLPNIMLYGAPGSGKYTRLMILLSEFFKNICSPYSQMARAIEVASGSFVPLPGLKKSNKKIIFAVVSKCHCEIDLEQAGSNKALLPFLEYYSKNRNINFNCHKYLILRNVRFLKREIQNALRTIIEKNKSKIRFLFTINSITNIIPPLRSRFICISIVAPKYEEAFKIITEISEKEGWQITPKKKEAIIQKSLYGTTGSINLRELLLTLEASFLISDKKITKIYVSERNEASDKLLKAVKKGKREEIRSLLYRIFEMMKNDFSLIVTCDLFRKLLPIVKDKHKFITLTAKWNSEITKPFITQQILQAEAYLFAVCDLCDF